MTSKPGAEKTEFNPRSAGSTMDLKLFCNSGTHFGFSVGIFLVDSVLMNVTFSLRS